ncbi:outer membrane protein assembly factor BamB family protein [Actinomadura violacea]|uniref:PQQ-binding-like beta-propeller repeat protein n=1 Tax=Actinomadura violacea TaxID=2819934 RepID=A0ABS3RJV1_9ACTN|nr:PQQ-binding-like beta-propeller repeat protein [Actinomadura violacea]MBO2457021.1 PQQ-binding-like beta-propeller repeat protein [Actinomadura violacea]
MPEPAVRPAQPPTSQPPQRGPLNRVRDRRWTSRRLPEPVRRLPAADRPAVARALRKCVPPADPSLDEPALALSAYTRGQIRRYGWIYLFPPVGLLILSAAMLIASHEERRLGTTIVWIGVAIVTPASAVRRLVRLERLEAAIRARDENATTGPGHRRRMRAPSAATATIVAGILVIASGLWLQWDAHRDRPDWTIDGPHGAFPAPIAAQAPLHPQKVVATYPFDVLTYRGVAIEATPKSASVTAHRIRPAGTYWRFTRRDHRLVDADLDPATGRLLLVWAHLDPDTRTIEAPLQAMVIDVRTGKVRWNRTVPSSSDSLEGAAVIGRSAVIPAEAFTVLDPATGRPRWRLRDRCGQAPAGTAGGTLLVGRMCPDSGLLVEGHDSATGRRLWSKSFASWWPGRSLARELPVSVDALSRNRIVVWTLEREAVYDATTGARIGEHRQLVHGDGKVFDAEAGYAPCSIRVSGGHRKGICATDPVSGRRLWSFPFPGADETTQLRSPVAVADGRVYTLSSDHGGEIADHVDVNDARTGALLARVSPPLPERGRLYGVQAVDGGALVLTADLLPTPSPNRTVLLGDG